MGAHQFGNKPVISGAMYIERYPSHILPQGFNESKWLTLHINYNFCPGHPFGQYFCFLMRDFPYTPCSYKWRIPNVTQNPLSVDTIFTVPRRGNVVSHIKLEVLVYFLPVFGFSPSNFEGNAHLPFESFGRSFPSCI